ncbi:MAG: serine/threonine-protein kinase [Pseudomonadota bacterium]
MGGHPARIGKYVVDGVIGEGAMGVVYRGHDPDIDRVVAIKTIHARLLAEAEAEVRARGPEGSLLSSDDWLSRFSREAKAAGRVLDPNLVTVFEYLVQDGAPYLVMEYVEAETLAKRIARGPLPGLAEIASIMRQMLSGLAAAHRAGIIHRDVKPANVMLLPDGRVKLADFGVARVEALGATQAGMVGTPSYMSPEQFRGDPADQRADLFAAGVILFELITGRKPYAATGLAQLSEQVLAGRWQRLSSLVPELPAGLDTLFERSLAPDPADRFATADDFGEALLAVLASPEAQAADAADRTVIAPPAGRAAGATGTRPEGSLGTGIAGASGVGGSTGGLSRTLLDQIPAAVYGRIERALMEHFGPIGRVWVRKAATSTNDVEQMIDLVASQIGDAAEAERFRKALREELRDVSNAGIRKEVLAEIARLLSPYVGPIAPVLVRRTATKVSSEAELCHSLADHITCDRDRAEFLDRIA